MSKRGADLVAYVVSALVATASVARASPSPQDVDALRAVPRAAATAVGTVDSRTDACASLVAEPNPPSVAHASESARPVTARPVPDGPNSIATRRVIDAFLRRGYPNAPAGSKVYSLSSIVIQCGHYGTAMTSSASLSRDAEHLYVFDPTTLVTLALPVESTVYLVVDDGTELVKPGEPPSKALAIEIGAGAARYAYTITATDRRNDVRP